MSNMSNEPDKLKAIYSERIDDKEKFPLRFRELLGDALLAQQFTESTAQAKNKFLSGLESYLHEQGDEVAVEEFAKYRELFKRRKSDLYDLIKECVDREVGNAESSSSSDYPPLEDQLASDEMEVDSDESGEEENPQSDDAVEDDANSKEDSESQEDSAVSLEDTFAALQGIITQKH